MQALKTVQEQIRTLLGETAFLSGCGFNLRSCGCLLAYFNFTGLDLAGLKSRETQWRSELETLPFNWEVAYLNPFPGTDKIGKLTCREFCPHCRENYRSERTLGVSSQVWLEKP